MMYTHIFNLLATLTGLTIGIVGPLVSAKLLYEHSPPSWLFLPLLLGWILIAVVLLKLVLWPGANWLYLLIFRKTRVAFQEARELSPLFMINKHMQWFPMREIVTMDIKDRVPYMREFLKKCQEEGIIKLKK